MKIYTNFIFCGNFLTLIKYLNYFSELIFNRIYNLFHENDELLNKKSNKKLNNTSIEIEPSDKKVSQPVKRIQSEKFLSKLNKFEQLSRGSATNYLRHSSSATDNFDSNASDQKFNINLPNENFKLNENKSKKDQDLIKLSQTRLVEMLTASFNNKSFNGSTENAYIKNDEEKASIKYNFKILKGRDVKSKSFGCEKDLKVNFKTRNIFNMDNSNIVNKSKFKMLNKSCKKNFAKNAVRCINKIDSTAKQQIENTTSLFDHTNLIYIDDEDLSINETIVPNSSNNDQEFDDDYDEDNVIYEGDSDENNDLNDFANVVKDDYDFENNNDLNNNYDENSSENINIYNNYKCKSAPISPISQKECEYSQKTFPYKDDFRSYKKNLCNQSNKNNFVYDMNLFNDKAVNDDMIFKNNVRALKDYSNRNSNNSSIISLNHNRQNNLEPLLIQEVKNSTDASVDISPNRTATELKIKNQSDLVLSSSSSSSSSTNESKSATESNSTTVSLLKNQDSQNENLHNLNGKKHDEENRNSPVLSASESTSSSSINTNDVSVNSKQDDHYNDQVVDQSSQKSDKNNIIVNSIATESLNDNFHYRDVNSSENNTEISDENSSASSTTTDLSKNNLKINYEKAKRERQMEQEQAEIEKKRLQEILDICMEFQRQEEVKLLSANTTPNKRVNSKYFSSALSDKINQTEISIITIYITPLLILKIIVKIKKT